MNDLDNQQRNEAKECLGEFWERITTSQDPEIQSLINSENDENNVNNKVYVSEQSSKRIKQVDDITYYNRNQLSRYYAMSQKYI
ncbi:unnamed protein product [Rhizophagus irregularis]|nr:unnamed protein product [Rhizophagus irregularis]